MANLRRNITFLLWRNSLFVEKFRVSFSTDSEVKLKPKPLKHPPTNFEFLAHKHNLSTGVASRVYSLLNVPNRKKTTLEKFDSALSYFKEIGFTQSELERALIYMPSILSIGLDKTVKPKVKILQDFGFSFREIASIISKEPSILRYSAKDRIVPALELLKDLLGSIQIVAKVVNRTGRLLTHDLEKNLVPNVKLLKSCGITMEQILTLFNRLPRFLLYKPEVIRECIRKVEEMGVDRNSRMFVHALMIVGSMANGAWEPKLQAFRNILEVSDEDISRLLRRYPNVFSVSKDKMKRMKEVLVATGKYKTSSILQSPEALYYSIEKRYKPRFEVLAILETRHLIKGWPSLGKLCRMGDTKFFDVFVGPHLKDPEICTWYNNHTGKGGLLISTV